VGEQERALCRHGSEPAAALRYAARASAARGRHREAAASLVAAWEQPGFEPDGAGLDLAIRSLESLDDLEAAARFVAGVERLADSRVAAEAHLRLAQAYEAAAMDEQAVDAYWRALERSREEQHQCRQTALDGARRVATRNLWHGDVARARSYEAPETDAVPAEEPSAEGPHLSLVAYPVKDAILVGGIKLDIYRTELKAMVRRDALPVPGYPVYFRLRPLTSTGVSFPPRIRHRLAYTDVNGVATTVLRSGDMRETLEVLVSAGPIEETLRVEIQGITGVSMVEVPKFTPEGLRTASLDARVMRCMCRMPGDDGQIDLVRVETVASGGGERLPVFPTEVYVSPTAGADPVRKVRAKTDYEGRITSVVRVPAGAAVTVRAIPASVEEAACRVTLNPSADVAESRGFARSATLPVRGRSRLEEAPANPAKPRTKPKP
jgi:hypothetical protein